MANRYYFHGDKVEDKKSTYYCASCDLFVNKNHFEEAKHCQTNEKRYQMSIHDGKTLKINSSPKHLYRKINSENLFSNSPKLKAPKTSTFLRWLKKQIDRDDIIGDLSNDVLRDKSFPLNTNSLEKIKGHLCSKLSSSEAFFALEEAHKEFKNTKNIRSGLSQKIRFQVFKRDEYQCQICGHEVSDGVKLEVDHKIPVAKGGTDDITNLWTLCFSCNRGKGVENL